MYRAKALTPVMEMIDALWIVISVGMVYTITKMAVGEVLQ
jgi:hypothetical protein